jgi:cell division protein FtsQ
MSGTFGRMMVRTQDSFYMASAHNGFAVRDILVEGRRNADPDILLGLIGSSRGDPIFAFDPVAARQSLEKETWIETARVERRLPNVIYVSIKERVPFALWQNRGKIRLIDSSGVVITDVVKDVARFRDLPLVVGDGAASAASSLLDLMKVEPEVMKRVEAATYVGGRRWDLKLKNNIMVRLPETDLALALRRLGEAQEKDALLDKDMESIDLREQNRIVIRTKPGVAAEDYKVSYKADKAI